MQTAQCQQKEQPLMLEDKQWTKNWTPNGKTLYLGPEKDKDEMCSSFNFHKIT